MLEISTLMLQLGIVMLVAFIGAALASRFKLSVIIGYIVAGILIGPFINIDIFGYNYTGLIQDTSFVNQLSYIGLVLLLFFVGLRFPFSRLRTTKEAAVVLALMNIGINMFGGFVIGTYLGWPLIDTIFIAGVISMSSSAVTAKSLMDLKRLSNAETQFLVSVVVLESFIAMFLLTTVNGFVISSGSETVELHWLFLGVALFIGFFAFLASVVIPYGSRFFERIKSDELFLLFALGIVFLSAALAEVMRIPAIIGAFFIGVSFANTKLVSRIEEKLAGLRDAFVAIFFLAFGMMINPAALPNVIGIVLLAVPLIFLNDLFLTSSLAYFLGFSGKAATAIGTSLVGRNEEAILYASVGTRAIQSNPSISHNYGGTLLNPFTGMLCIATSSLAPICMKRSDQIARFFGRRVPKFMKFGGDLVKRTLRTFTLPAYLPLYKRTKRLVLSLSAYTALVIALIVTQGYLHLALAVLIPLAIYSCWIATRTAFVEPVKHTNYGLGKSPAHSSAIQQYVLRIVIGALVVMMLIAFLWQYMWQGTLILLVGYFIGIVLSMKSAYNTLVLRKSPLIMPIHTDGVSKTYRRGWRFARRTNNGRRRL